MICLSAARVIFLIFIMLQISTYNCQSSKRNAGGIHKVCESSDIVFLQEHWLFPSDIHSLNSIHLHFISFGVSSMDPSASLIAGRPFGGVAVLWRNALAPHVKPIVYDDDRIMGLEFTLDGAKILFLGVYLPYNTHLNFDKSVHYLAKDKAIIDDFDSPFVCVLGNFNTDRVKATEFGKELESFCRDSQLSIVDVMHLPRDSTTRMNDGHGTESWLDHFVCTKGFMDFIGGVGINRFIKIDIQNGGISSEVSGAGLDGRWVVDWASLGPDDLRAYASAAEANLKQIDVPFELLQCGICSSIDHMRAIDVYYDKIIASLRAASESTISKKLGGKARRNIPGWNDFVKDNHVLCVQLHPLHPCMIPYAYV